MKLKAILDNLDGLSDEIAGLYVEFDAGDGVMKFKLNVEGLDHHPEIKALRTALNRQKDETRTAKTAATAAERRLEGLPDDFDAVKYEEMLATIDAKPGAKSEEEIRTEAAAAAKKAAETKAQKDREPIEADRDRYRTRLEVLERDRVLNEALDAAKIEDPYKRRAARALLKDDIHVVEQDGEFVAIAKHSDIGDIPVAEHVNTWVQTDEGKTYVSPRGSEGGGSEGDAGHRDADPNNSNPWKPGKGFNVTRQALIMRTKPAEAERLKKEAGVRT